MVLFKEFIQTEYYIETINLLQQLENDKCASSIKLIERNIKGGGPSNSKEEERKLKFDSPISSEKKIFFPQRQQLLLNKPPNYEKEIKKL